MLRIKSVAVLSVLAIALVLTGCNRKDRQQRAAFFTDRLNPYTPILNQGHKSTCWVYAMLATIETEHLGKGDSVHLSPFYAERQLLAECATQAYLSQNHFKFTVRGMASRLIRLIETHGIMPYDAYRYGESVNTTVLSRKVKQSVKASVQSRTGLTVCMERANALLDYSLGPCPPHVFMLGAQYTPQEFARSVCAPDEYESLTSFTHHPFYSSFVLEIPDNVDRDLFYNVPLDTLVQRIAESVMHGHGVCWEGDISEHGFSFSRGVADVSKGTSVSTSARQQEFEHYQTTDDHCMAIVGLAHNSKGRRFFIMKNSWGTHNPYGGLMYVSEDYVRLKTIAVYIPHNRR